MATVLGKPAYGISPTDPARARTEILELWRRNLPTATPDRFDWLYASGRARAWLLRDQGQFAVGSVGLMDRNMDVLGEPLCAGQAIDLNVDAGHRSAGPAVGLQRAVTADADGRGCRLLYAFPNAQSEPVLRRVGYRVLGPVQRWIKPLRPGTLLARHGHDRFVRRAGALLSLPLDLVAHLSLGETTHRRPRGVATEIISDFDTRFDRFWQRVRGSFPICGERTVDYLSWRFRHTAAATPRIVCLVDHEGELLAYLLAIPRDGMVFINDILFDSHRHLGLLLAECFRWARSQGMHAAILVYLGSTRVARTFRRLGLWQRRSPWKALVRADSGRFGRELADVTNPEYWHLTRADIDTEF